MSIYQVAVQKDAQITYYKGVPFAYKEHGETGLLVPDGIEYPYMMTWGIPYTSLNRGFFFFLLFQDMTFCAPRLARKRARSAWASVLDEYVIGPKNWWADFSTSSTTSSTSSSTSSTTSTTSTTSSSTSSTKVGGEDSGEDSGEDRRKYRRPFDRKMSLFMAWKVRKLKELMGTLRAMRLEGATGDRRSAYNRGDTGLSGIELLSRPLWLQEDMRKHRGEKLYKFLTSCVCQVSSPLSRAFAESIVDDCFPRYTKMVEKDILLYRTVSEAYGLFDEEFLAAMRGTSRLEEYDEASGIVQYVECANPRRVLVRQLPLIESREVELMVVPMASMQGIIKLYSLTEDFFAYTVSRSLGYNISKTAATYYYSPSYPERLRIYHAMCGVSLYPSNTTPDRSAIEDVLNALHSTVALMCNEPEKGILFEAPTERRTTKTPDIIGYKQLPPGLPEAIARCLKEEGYIYIIAVGTDSVLVADAVAWALKMGKKTPVTRKRVKKAGTKVKKVAKKK